MSDLHAQLRAAIEQRLDRARRMERMAQEFHLEVQEPKLWGKQVPGWGAWPEVEQLAHQLAEVCEADLRRLERHQRIEQNDYSKWPVRPEPACLYCQLTSHDDGDPIYRDWPCDDIRDLAAAYALDIPGSQT